MLSINEVKVSSPQSDTNVCKWLRLTAQELSPFILRHKTI